MHSYFFGPSERQLLAVHHHAQGTPRRDHGVVLCYPWGYEYVNALRGCRQLATRLARAGFDVLRFEFYGCGDSAGWGEEADLERWLDDVSAALGELGGRGRARAVSLVGVRLGGSLAALAAARRSDVQGLVLWEPVVSGASYLADLRLRHAAFLASEREEGRSQATYNTPDEIMGFPLSGTLASGLEQLDLRTIARAPAAHVLVVGEQDAAIDDAFTAHLRQLGSDVSLLALPGTKIWMRKVGHERALVPVPILDAVSAWFSDRWPA